MLTAGPAERRFAIAAVLVTLVVFLATAPFARTPLLKEPAFIPSYEAALITIDLLTAALLFGQYFVARAVPLLVLANGYVFTALMTIVHGLTFPGLFSESGLLGAGPQTTAWLYMFWHGGFPIFLIAYARAGATPSGRRTGRARVILSSLLAVMALVAALAVLATVGESLLPSIMRGNGYTPSMIGVVGTVWGLGLIALFVLWRRRPHSVLDLWLMVVSCAWLCDVALSAVLNKGRFDLGFYAGRAYGLAAASFVLIALLVETSALYTRLARAMEAERQERELRLATMRSELIHISRLGELGQMSSALAHEVRQPLTAVANYISSCRKLLQQGDVDKALAGLAKAADAAATATSTIQRLRNFIQKKENKKQVEDIKIVIDEAIALAVMAAERDGVDVVSLVHPQASTAFIDKIQIQQVLLNLVRNAIEAMADASEPRLAITTQPSAAGEIEVSVADTGPGLSPEIRARLFQPFLTTKTGGTGIGLSICRSIIEGHSGRLWAEDNPGGGAVFKFTLLRDAPARDEPEALLASNG